jgi:hypothetical protein
MELAELTAKIEKTQRFFLSTTDKRDRRIYARQLKILKALLAREKTYIKQKINNGQTALFDEPTK